MVLVLVEKMKSGKMGEHGFSFSKKRVHQLSYDSWCTLFKCLFIYLSFLVKERMDLSIINYILDSAAIQHPCLPGLLTAELGRGQSACRMVSCRHYVLHRSMDCTL